MSAIDFNGFNRGIIEDFRANAGKVGGPFAEAPMMLLTTTGAKSGKQHVTPLVHTTSGDDLVIIASKGGDPKHPAWYHNLLADPTVEVEVGSERYTATARIAEGDERQALWDAQAALMPNFTEYQTKTTRLIPVVVLERVG
jgi:deazaflavin-dependent oxidoreductase (nitroreductase family)